MQDISINPNGVKEHLKDLKVYKAAEPDGIPTFILRSAAEELWSILSRIYQCSIDTGSVPSDWREALIVPLFKKLQTCVTDIRSMQSARAHCSSQHHVTPRPEQQSWQWNNMASARNGQLLPSWLLLSKASSVLSLRSDKDQVDVVLLEFLRPLIKSHTSVYFTNWTIMKSEEIT